MLLSQSCSLEVAWLANSKTFGWDSPLSPNPVRIYQFSLHAPPCRQSHFAWSCLELHRLLLPPKTEHSCKVVVCFLKTSNLPVSEHGAGKSGSSWPNQPFGIPRLPPVEKILESWDLQEVTRLGGHGWSFWWGWKPSGCHGATAWAHQGLAWVGIERWAASSGEVPFLLVALRAQSFCHL